VACLAIALLPATASAAVRYASPTGSSSGQCPQTTPCEIEFAVEAVAQPNDEVVVASGTYALGSDVLIVSDAGLDLHGAEGQPTPMITSSAPTSGLAVNAAATVRDLRVETTGSNAAVVLNAADSVAERMWVWAHGGFDACRLSVGALFRDSVCYADNPGTSAVRFSSSTSGLAYALNVTAVASTFSGSGTHAIEIEAHSGAQVTLLPRNVIAIGVDGDISLQTFDSATSRATGLITNSNFDELVGLGGPGVEAGTPAGTEGNQLDPPTLASVSGADFHQLDGSPTINAGGGSSELGSLDIDREQRVQGTAPDIGADEFPEATPPPPGEGPSNEFGFGKVKRNKRKGTAKLTVNVPGPGTVELAKTKRLKPGAKEAGAAGAVKLKLKSRGRTRAKLRQRGRAKVRAKVTFSPQGGEPNTRSKRVKLVRR
jgi:hypothetical protein